MEQERGDSEGIIKWLLAETRVASLYYGPLFKD
jgi:hypothetical protein